MSAERDRELALCEVVWGHILAAQNFDGPPTPSEVIDFFCPPPKYPRGDVQSALMELLHVGRVAMAEDRSLTVVLPPKVDAA